MTETARSIHPDLLDEQPVQASGSASAAAPAPSSDQTAVASTPPAGSAGRDARGRFQSASPAAESVLPTPSAESPPDVATSPDNAGEPAAEPEWWQAARQAKDPAEALSLLAKNIPKDQLERDPTLQGWIGDMGQRRARELLERQQRDAAEQQRREALARGDYYQLGELTAPDLLQAEQQRQQAQTTAPFMDGVVAFQSALPPEVQAQIAGKQWGVGKTYAEGVQEYMGAAVDALVSHRLNQQVEAEIKKREPALRKAFLSETNGGEPVPELDGGPAASVREITDEQIDRMSLAEYDTYFDANGQPRAGTRVRLTRGIPLNRR